MAETIYAVNKSRGVIYRLQRDIDSIAVIDCDDPSALLSHGLIKIDHEQVLRGLAQLSQITNEEGKVGIYSTDGYLLTLDIISAREAYKLACEHAPNRGRFPLRFITGTGRIFGRDNYVMAYDHSTHNVLEKHIKVILILALEGNVQRETRPLEGTKWQWARPGHGYIVDPSGWHEAIKAACQWRKEHRPDA